MRPETASRLWGALIAILVAVAALEALGIVFAMVGSKVPKELNP